MEQTYTVVCPGASRFDGSQRDRMAKDDKRLHMGYGWEVDTFPVKCQICGDEAQPRGSYGVVPLG